MNMIPKRHDLVFLSELGRQYVWEHLSPEYQEDPVVQKYFLQLPGIFRVQPPDLGEKMLSLGYSFPFRDGANRMRFAAQAPADEIVRVITPWEIPNMERELPYPYKTAMVELAQRAESAGLHFGVFGSAALQMATSLPYLHSKSDLDVIIAAARPEAIRSFYRELTKVSDRFCVGVDAELIVSETCYVKLGELMQGSKTILAKGSYHPQLLSSQWIWDTMAAMPQ